MRLLLTALVLVACGSDKPATAPPKRPNNELILGKFERHPPAGSTAMWLRADGSVTVAHDQSKLDSQPLASGTWKLEGDQLTLEYGKGMCESGGAGTYKIVLSRIGIHFTKVDDACEQRAKIDGETWYRIK